MHCFATFMQPRWPTDKNSNSVIIPMNLSCYWSSFGSFLNFYCKPCDFCSVSAISTLICCSISVRPSSTSNTLFEKSNWNKYKKMEPKFRKSTTKHNLHFGNCSASFNNFAGSPSNPARLELIERLSWQHQTLWGADAYKEMLLKKLSDQIYRLCSLWFWMDYHTIHSSRKMSFWHKSDETLIEEDGRRVSENANA